MPPATTSHHQPTGNRPGGLSFAPLSNTAQHRTTDPRRPAACMERIARECTDCKKWGGDIKRPPQSWCYVEDVQAK